MSIDLEALALSVKQLQDRHHRALDAALAPLGVTLIQWNALREIGRNPGAPQRKLARLSFNSDQAFGMLVGRLAKQGLVRREDGPGRAIVHSLTDNGADLLLRGRTLVLSVFERSFTPLNEAERGLLQKLLNAVLDSPPGRN